MTAARRPGAQVPAGLDVLVAGGGPVGLMLACELGLAGARCAVLERLTEPDDTPKANGLVGQVVEVLDRRGLLGRFAADAPFVGPGEEVVAEPNASILIFLNIILEMPPNA